MSRSAAGVLLLLTITGSAAVAQRPDSLRRDTLRFRLQPIDIQVLRGTAADLRAAAAVTSVSRAAIQDAQLTAGLDEALAIVPGVVVNNRYNFSLGSRIAVRGLGARAAFGVRGVRLLQDGIPLTMPDGQANVNNIDLGSAARIEVLRGPASSLYGNAAGGVISIETEPAPSGSFAGELRTVAGNMGRDALSRLTKHQVKAGGRHGALDYLVSAARLQTDGYRAHSRAEQSVFNTRLGITASPSSRWTLLFNVADAPTAQNPGALPLDSAEHTPSMAWPRNVATGSGEAARQAQAGLAYRQHNTNSILDLSVYGLTRSLENPLPFAFITVERKGAGARASYQHTTQLAGRSVEVIVGTDVEHQADERGEFDNVNGKRGSNRSRDQTDQVTSAGPFAQLQLAVTPRLGLTAGLRYDVIRFTVDDRFLDDGRDDEGERTLSALSPRVALSFALSDAASAYASIGTAFQTPTTTELLNRAPGAGEPCCPGGFNPGLEPQRALNFELGFKGRLADRLRYEAALYQMAVRDALVPFQLPQGDGREFFRNAGETRHRGFELALTTILARAAMLEAAYTYSNFDFLDDGSAADAHEGNAVPGVAPHHLFTRLKLQPHARLSFEVEDEFTSRFFVDDANEASSDAANVVDVRVQFRVPAGSLDLRPFLAVNNLFDERYSSSVVINAAGARYYEPAPGRNVYLGAALRFGRW